MTSGGKAGARGHWQVIARELSSDTRIEPARDQDTLEFHLPDLRASEVEVQAGETTLDLASVVTHGLQATSAGDVTVGRITVARLGSRPANAPGDHDSQPWGATKLVVKALQADRSGKLRAQRVTAASVARAAAAADTWALTGVAATDIEGTLTTTVRVAAAGFDVLSLGAPAGAHLKATQLRATRLSLTLTPSVEADTLTLHAIEGTASGSAWVGSVIEARKVGWRPPATVHLERFGLEDQPRRTPPVRRAVDRQAARYNLSRLSSLHLALQYRPDRKTQLTPPIQTLRAIRVSTRRNRWGDGNAWRTGTTSAPWTRRPRPTWSGARR